MQVGNLFRVCTENGGLGFLANAPPQEVSASEDGAFVRGTRTVTLTVFGENCQLKTAAQTVLLFSIHHLAEDEVVRQRRPLPFLGGREVVFVCHTHFLFDRFRLLSYRR